MLIDTHAHLDYDYECSTEALLEAARASGVDRVIAIAAAVGSLEPAKALAERFANVFFTTGIHPHDAKDLTPEVLAQMRALSAHPKCVAIGELGLDYYYNHAPKEEQHRALAAQLDFSVECGKPVVVHTRDADDDTLLFLTRHSQAWRARHGERAPGVIHCFTGTAALASSCLALGYYISFSGVVTFKNADPLRAVARDLVPLERLLVETDSPFLAPVPFRGKKNQPAHTRQVAEKVAELKGLSLEKVAAQTTANAEALFGLPASAP